MAPRMTPRFLRLALVPALGLALLSACRDRSATPDSALATDSSLAQDLAMAQRNAPGPLVFNDAPAGAEQPSARATTSPAPRPAMRRTPAPSVRAPRTPASVVATTGSNGAYIPAGSTVVLEVASVSRADPIEQSRIIFRVRAIDVDGVARPADGDVATLGGLEPVHTASGNERSKVIGGAVAGAILGRILGGSTKATVIGGAAGAAAGTVAAQRGGTSDACLPNGSAMRLTLSRDLLLPRGGAL